MRTAALTPTDHSLSQSLFQAIVAEAPFGLVVIAGDLPVYANSAALRMFGCESLERLTGFDILAAFDAATRLLLHDASRERHVGEEVMRAHDAQVISADGRVVDTEMAVRVIATGEQIGMILTFRDITDRKRSEREQTTRLLEQESLGDIDKLLVGITDIRRLLDTILSQAILLVRPNWAGIMLLDDDGLTVEWRGIKGNRQAPPVEAFRPDASIRAILDSVSPLVTSSAPGSRSAFDAVPGFVGEGLMTLAWFPLLGEKGVMGSLVVGYRSMHELVDAEMRFLETLSEKTSIAVSNAALLEDLRQHERELERLSGARVNAQEEERRRIAREIHDGVGQILTAIKFNVEILEDSTTIAAEERKRLEDVRGLLDSVMKEAREISYNLMPSVLDDFGLAPALQLFCERTGTRTNVKIDFYAQGMQERLSPQLEIALYRIVQEAISNSLRHGLASAITVQVFRLGEKVRLTIEDNGKGMTTTERRSVREDGGGIGLLSMRERVNSFRGTLQVESAPDKGTMIAVEVPVGLEKE